MALNSGKILMRRGQEVNFDPNKMMPGEWAVSLDSKYVRMCFSPGVCVRMATYEAFESDMEQIRQILAECESIEQAVSLINTEVSQNAKAVIEHTKEAKQYRDEAKQYRDEAFSTTPDGYDSLVGQVDKNTVAINAIVEKAELNIKETAMGDNIHLIDSAEGKNVEFALYGKAVQNKTTGKNLLNPNEITVGSWWGSGNAMVTNANQVCGKVKCEPNTQYSLWSVIKTNYYYFNFLDKDENYISKTNSNATSEYLIATTPSNCHYIAWSVYIDVATLDKFNAINVQLEEGSKTTYEPYTGGIPSPNPDYPQDIDVAGSGGSVEVKSVGKNWLKNTATSQTINDVTFTVNKDKSITASGTSTGRTVIAIKDKVYLKKAGKYKLSGCPSGGSQTTYRLLFGIKKSDGTFLADIIDYGNGASFSITQEMIDSEVYGAALLYVFNGYTASNVTFKPMIRLASDTDDTYEPYKETLSTIPTTDFAGIKVDSNGNYTDSNGQQWIANEIVKYADGSGEKIQRIGKERLQTIESSYPSTEGNLIGIISTNAKNVSNNNVVGNIISNMYLATTANIQYTTNMSAICVMNKSGVAKIGISNKDVSTIDELTAFLNENEVIALYELAEPIRTPLTAEEIAEIEKLSTFYPVTNISNDFDCGMKVKYIVDSKNYIDNQLAIQAKLQEEALLNMLLLMPEEVQASMIEKDTNNLLNESEV